MATLYVENLPDDLYKALRERARSGRKSMAQEVITILQQFVPTPAEFAERRRFVRTALRMSARKPSAKRSFPSAEEMVREDRAR